MLILIIIIGSIFLIEALALYIEYRSAKKIADSIIESVLINLYNQEEEESKDCKKTESQ